jgi:hypothetical protein
VKLDRRIVYAPELTPDQVRSICADCQARGLAKAGLGVTLRPPFSEKLAGRELTLRFTDYPDLQLRFAGGEELSWSEGGQPFVQEYCQILELNPDDNLFYVHHLRAGTFPLESFSYAIDLATGLATLDHASIGAAKRIREVDHEFHFGTIVMEGQQPPTVLHDFTRDMDGLIIDWKYDRLGTFAVRHFYVDHLHKIDRIIREGRSTFFSAVTCDYIKIRDNIYLMSWLETYGQGVEGTALIDMTDLHDVGSFFGINYEGTLDSHTFAAQGERVAQF